MAAIIMSCPNTGATVGTGQHVRAEDFAAADTLTGRFRCSSCNQVHGWTKVDVRLTEWPGATSTS